MPQAKSSGGGGGPPSSSSSDSSDGEHEFSPDGNFVNHSQFFQNHKLIYEKSPKHKRKARGDISAAPVNGQEALNVEVAWAMKYMEVTPIDRESA